MILKNSNKKIIKFKKQLYDVIIFAVPHYEFYEFLKKNINNILKNGVFVDLNKNAILLTKQDINMLLFK